jgi:hypothetical protein
MIPMMRIDKPVLFDANILINFKGQMRFLFGFFSEILIHSQVKNEVMGQAIRNEIEALEGTFNIKYVEDSFPTDNVSSILFGECDKELKASFNIDKSDDLGEYKTLLFAKFNNITILSSQDTTVWSFVTKSKNFMGIKCITIQDFAYIVYLSASNGKDRKLAKALYGKYAREEHPFEYFKKYMNRNNDEIPLYIEFENNRIQNYEELIQQYVEYYSDTEIDKAQVVLEMVNISRHLPDTCLSCIYSRIDKNKVDFSIRSCTLGYSLNDAECINIREGFDTRIRNSDR